MELNPKKQGLERKVLASDIAGTTNPKIKYLMERALLVKKQEADKGRYIGHYTSAYHGENA